MVIPPRTIIKEDFFTDSPAELSIPDLRRIRHTCRISPNEQNERTTVMSMRTSLGIAAASMTALAATLIAATPQSTAAPATRTAASVQTSEVRLAATTMPMATRDYQRGFQKGYREGFGGGFRDGRTACKKHVFARTQSQRQADFERGYADGYDRGYGSGFALGCRRR